MWRQQGQFLLQHSIDLRVRYRNSSNETINMLLLTCGTPSGHAFTSQSKTLISNKTLDMTWQVLNHSSRIIAACSQAPSSARNSPKSRPYPSLLVKVSHWYKKKHLFIFIYIYIYIYVAPANMDPYSGEFHVFIFQHRCVLGLTCQDEQKSSIQSHATLTLHIAASHRALENVCPTKVDVENSSLLVWSLRAA